MARVPEFCEHIFDLVAFLAEYLIIVDGALLAFDGRDTGLYVDLGQGKTMDTSDFQIDFFSDVKYENLTIEISFQGQILCQLNKDKGENNIEIEFFNQQRMLEQEIKMKFSLDKFLTTIEEAIKELKNVK